MNPKTVKIDAEYEKNRIKISELQSRQRELERQRKEIENSEILELVQSFKLDADSLAALLRTMNNNPAPVVSANGVPTKFDNFVGRGGMTKRTDSERSSSEEFSGVHDDDKEDVENETEND